MSLGVYTCRPGCYPYTWLRTGHFPAMRPRLSSVTSVSVIKLDYASVRHEELP